MSRIVSVVLVLFGCSRPAEEAPVTNDAPPAAAVPQPLEQHMPPPAPLLSSPERACSLMSEQSDFSVGRWRDREVPDDDGNQWGCVSNYVDLPPVNVRLPNNLAFYAMGDRDSAKLFKLVLNVNHPAAREAALARFASSAERMHISAFRSSPQGFVMDTVRRGEPTSAVMDGHRVNVTVTPYAKGGIRGGFTIKYIVLL